MPVNTLASLQAQVLTRLDGNSLLYPPSEITLYANEAQRIVNNITGLLQTTASYPGTTQAGRVWYDTPAPILIPLKVQFAGRYLHKSSLLRTGQRNPTWTKDTTAITGSPVARWVPAGLTKFALHPADSTGGFDLAVTGVRDPTLLVNSSDTIPFPDEYEELLEDITAFAIQLKEGFPLFQAAFILYGKVMAKLGQNARWRDLEQPAYVTQRTSSR